MIGTDRGKMAEQKVFQGSVGVNTSATRHVLLQTTNNEGQTSTVMMTPDEALNTAKRLIQSAQEVEIARGQHVRRRLGEIAEELKSNMDGSALQIDNAIGLMEAVQAAAALVSGIEEAAGVTCLVGKD